MWDPATTAVIANPNAAGGRVGRDWSRLSATLERHLGKVQLLRTERPQHAIGLARAAVEGGARTVLSLGGDGTHNEVVNGIMDASPEPGAVTLGVLPAGTGGDFRRLLIANQDVETAAAAMTTARCDVIDLGRSSFKADDGSTGKQYFLNVASMGIGGLVCRKVNDSSKRLGGKPTFYLATLRASAEYKPANLRLLVDGENLGVFPVLNVAIANGRFFGGGMMVAPDARLGDGLLDVVVLPHQGQLKVLELSRHIYKGTHVRKPEVIVRKARDVVLKPVDDNPAWVELDGEAPGVAPCRVEVIPGAIRLLGARPEVL